MPFGEDQSHVWRQKFLPKLSQGPSGLRWKEAGPEEVENGTEIENEKLATALQQKGEFASGEWDLSTLPS